MTFGEHIEKALTPFPVLETKRLMLREIRYEDAAAVYSLRADARVGAYISRQPAKEIKEAEDLIQKMRDAYNNKQAIGWAAVRKNSAENEIIGACGFNHIDFLNRRAEIGGEMAVNHWGKFLAIEAVKAIIDFGFKTLKFHTIEAKVSPQNKSAIYLLEKLGFQKEAHFRDYYFYDGNYRDLVIYSMLNPTPTPNSLSGKLM